MNAIEIGGDRYIKAADAADITGYATDYIGQLSRGGKIRAERVGRVWYVSEKDVLEHKKGNGNRSNKRKTQESLKREIADKGQIHHAFYDPLGSDLPEYRKRLLSEDVRYENDSHPLTPELEKVEETLEEAAPIAEEKEEVHEEPIVLSEIEETETESEPVDIPIATEVENEEEISDEANETVFEPHISSRIVEEEEKKDIQLVLNRKKSATSRKSDPIPHIPLSETKEVVPHGTPSYSLALPIGRILAPIALILALAFSASSIFFERVLVYEQGKSSIFRPSYEESFGMRAVSSVGESFRNEAMSLFDR